jgi:hypothetical protein
MGAVMGVNALDRRDESGAARPYFSGFRPVLVPEGDLARERGRVSYRSAKRPFGYVK